MADRICVSTEALEQCARELSQLQSKIEQTRAALSGVRMTQRNGGNLRMNLHQTLPNGTGISGDSVSEVVTSLKKALQKTEQEVKKLSAAIQKSAGMFENAEEKNCTLVGDLSSKAAGTLQSDVSALGGTISKIWSWVKWIIDKFKSGSSTESYDPFDGNGQFGGDQGSPKDDYENYELYRSIIEHNTGHQLTNSELETYLKRMNSEGCGYVAMCNTIFCMYKDNPQEFRERFGFDMYKDGDLNYNELFVDLYSTWDNKSEGGTFIPLNDYDERRDGPQSKYDYWNDPSGSGTNIEWRGDVIETYLANHGVDVKTEVHSSTTLTPEMYEKLTQNGTEQGMVQIRMSGSPAYLRDANGKVVHEYSGGHAMTVTGVVGTPPNQMLEVSSWGKRYYVNPNDFCASKNGQPTGSMGYMVVSK